MLFALAPPFHEFLSNARLATHLCGSLKKVEAFNKEMEEARNRYNDLRQLDVMLRELNTQGTTKEINNYRRFMNQVKTAVEVCS